MKRLILTALALSVALGLGLGTVAARRAPTPIPALAGKWKVAVLENIQEIPIWIVEIDKEGKTLTVLDGIERFKDAKVKGFSGEENGVTFTLETRGTTFNISAFPGKGEKPTELLGSIEFGPSRVAAVRLQRTEEKTLDPKADVPKEVPGVEDFKKAFMEKGEEREKGLKVIATNFGGKPIALLANRVLVQDKARSGDFKALKPILDAYVKESALYGRLLEENALENSVRVLLSSDKTAEYAVEYARRAEKLVRKTDSAPHQAAVLNLLANALRKAGKADEAKKLDEPIAKLEQQLDQEFEKRAVPFKTAPFNGRKGKSSRTAVVELFTGAQCPPCVAADIAFDAAAKTYGPRDAVFLQYHLHIPDPDPLTNADSVARQMYYGDKIEGTPTAFIDGVVTVEGLGGFTSGGEASFKKLAKQLDAELEQDAGAEIKLKVERKGDTIELAADVSGVKKPGEKVRLRFVLIQEVARYAGRNGQRMHHHVVRAMPGGAEGFKLEKASVSHKATVKISEVRKALDDYLSEFEKEKKGFTWDRRPLDLKHLKVVAFVQNDEDKKILQGAQTDVPAAE